MDLQGKQVFVTGGTGFTGGHLCAMLTRRGATVRALVRKTGNTQALQNLGARLVTGDLRDRGSFEAGLEGVDTVFHVGAAFREAKLSDADYTAINVGGTRNLIEAAARAGVRRFVHCSTVGVHGDTGREPATETTPFNPPDFYCQSKVEGELLARELFSKLNVQGSVFRPFGIYGPGDTRFLKLFRGVARGRFVMIGDGETLYQFGFVEDLCAGIILCGTKPEAVGEVFILGGEPPVTLNEVIEEVRRATGGPKIRIRIPMAPVMLAATVCEKVFRPLGIEPPLYPRRVEFFSKNRSFDISKAKRVLGYAPQVSIADGFARTAAWYREKGLL